MRRGTALGVRTAGHEGVQQRLDTLILRRGAPIDHRSGGGTGGRGATERGGRRLRVCRHGKGQIGTAHAHDCPCGQPRRKVVIQRGEQRGAAHRQRRIPMQQELVYARGPWKASAGLLQNGVAQTGGGELCGKRTGSAEAV